MSLSNNKKINKHLIDKMIKRENYLLFSLTKSKFLDNDEKEKVVGLGILGKVYLSDEFYEKVTEKIGNNFFYHTDRYLYFVTLPIPPYCPKHPNDRVEKYGDQFRVPFFFSIYIYIYIDICRCI